MINVIIADDEPLALIELKSLIPWEEKGFRIIGEFRNGKSALDFLLEHSETDLAILDINMPPMSGLQVVEERNRIDRPLEYLIVSAYSDYPLVRQAFKMGITDYIIKEELEPENLLPVLEKIIARVERHKISGGVSERPSKHREKEEMHRFLSGEDPAPENPLLNRKDCCFLLMKLEILLCRKDQVRIQNKALICMIEDLAGRISPGSFCIEDNNAYYLILPESKGNLIRELKLAVKQYFNKLLIVSSSDPAEKAEELPVRYRELKALHGFRSRSIRKSMEFIQENYSDSEISFEDLCEITGTSRSYLSTLFKQETGIGYKDYLNEVRISHAISLLDKTEMKVQEVSEQVGFSNVEHFSRTFKDRTGVSPSRYSRSK